MTFTVGVFVAVIGGILVGETVVGTVCVIERCREAG